MKPARAILSRIDPSPSNTRLPGARVSLALLLSINLVNYIDRSNLSAVEEQVRAQFFRPDDTNAKAWMGSLATAFLLTYMLMAPLFGWLADRMKRWAIIGMGVILWSVATGLCGLANSFTMLLLCRVFIGVGEAAWGPTAPTIIADLYPVSRRGAVMAWFNIALSVGSALGFIIGGQVAASYGWRWAFLAVAPPGLVLGILSLLRKDPPRGMSDGLGADSPRRRFQLADLWILARTRSYVFNTLGMAAMTFGVGGMAYWMVTYVHEFRMEGDLLTEAGRNAHAHINTLFGGILVAMGLGGTIAGGYMADWLHKRMKGGGAYFLLSGATMLAAFPVFLLVLYRPFPEAWFYMAAAMFLIFINTGPTNTIIANVTPPRMRATAFAINILVIHTLGDAVSPFFIGLIAERTRDAAHPKGNMNAGFAVVGAAIAVAGLLWIVGARWLKRDMEQAVRDA